MIIRAANEKDAYILSVTALSSLNEGMSKELFLASINNKQEIVLVCIEDNKCLGYLVSSFAFDESELIQIAVLEDYRKKGIATALLKEAILTYQKKDIKTMYLEVRESNTAAISFYYGFGFEKISKRPGFYKNPKEDALVLRLEIKDA